MRIDSYPRCHRSGISGGSRRRLRLLAGARFILLALTALLMLPAPPAQAGVNGMWLYDHDSGPVVGGTYRKARALVYTNTPGASLISATLLIGGETVQQRVLPQPPGAEPTYAELSVMWDTTHFADGSSVTIEAVGMDSSGAIGGPNHGVTIFNKAYVLGNLSLPFSGEETTYVTTRLWASNHSVNRNEDAAKEQILAGLPDYNLFFASTHGTPGGFTDSKPDPSLITAGEVEERVLTKTADQPPYHLAYLCACFCGSDGSLAGGFGMVTGVVNRAFVGYRPAILSCRHNFEFVVDVFTKLREGKPIGEAVRESLRTHDPPMGDARPHAGTDGGAPHGDPYVRADVEIYGDRATTIHGLYLYNDGRWFQAAQLD